MIFRSLVLLCLVVALPPDTSVVYAAAKSDIIEPGPNFSTWVLVDSYIEKADVDIIARIYEDPKNKNQEGFTKSIKTPDKKETLLVKTWGLERTNNGSVRDSNVQSALRLPNGDWFIGDIGEYPKMYMELGHWGYNLVIHVKKLDQKWYQRCLEDKKRSPQEDCSKFLYEKRENGMYISIPVRKYEK